MTRRLLGPICGPVVFFLVAALVFAGLAWVTYSALSVERAQRESAARAELGNNLRIALWQLDSRMLPALGVEDSRPYYHYAPPDPAATPLFVANLPEWMRLHFQLDPATGWSSPLVLDPETAKLVREAWADVAPRNMTEERAAVLDDLRARFPVRDTHDLFAATDRSIPEDSFSLAAPLIAGDTQVNAQPAPIPTLPNEPATKPAPQSPDSAAKGIPGGANPTADGEVVRLLGLELCLRDPSDESKKSVRPEGQQAVPNPQKKSDDINQAAGRFQRGMSQNQAANTRGGRLGQKDTIENEKQLNEWLYRAGLIDRAIREAKNAGEFQMPKGQLGNSYQNYVPGIDPRNTVNPSAPSTGNKPDTNPPTLPPLAGNGVLSNPIPPSGFFPPAPGGVPPGGGSGKGGGTQAIGPTFKSGERDGNAVSKTTLDKKKHEGTGGTDLNALVKIVLLDRFKLAYELTSWFIQPDSIQMRQALDRLSKQGLAAEIDRLKESEKPEVSTPSSLPATPPAATEQLAPSVIGPPAQPLAIHLGSMRPQWVMGRDGTDMLVLVRSAKVDGKTVYQGVVVDWPKLEEELKSVVRDLFPNAQLLPVKDSSQVSPDRAMTALPIQLDPGPEPELPPTGWTTLRLGLVLAWLAAIIAFAAVGFAGWSLIDLAERRIRFVSAVTHELRTPLTSLRLYLDLLVSGMVQDEQKRQEYLGTLATESDRLHRLIDNVLDFARLEKRKKNGDIKPVSVASLLDPLRATWTDRVALDGKELVVISTIPPELEVSTDPAMIQQIVGNLIDNARKYTRDASDNRIWLSAKSGPGNHVVLEVEDRGAGIPASERKSIFKPFRRGKQADSKAGGAGLGLALAKSWAEVLGARLTYRPADGGAGACFRLELPGT